MTVDAICNVINNKILKLTAATLQFGRYVFGADKFITISATFAVDHYANGHYKGVRARTALPLRLNNVNRYGAR